ncbi:AraC family transcriptional regulator [Paenibacillus alkaliterrae]|uniref:AraC family transcriptional regulator n=1 Tax=Paenibacillus alkaliterrae TaxID=320909 RepID=UPI001F287557|nr:AraC family transcriptional regulator [Paenibacillus alkaliterrae]MCF2937979.1 AraC family transcriptional regulator [Paenibacillus alkaliterrae]
MDTIVNFQNVTNTLQIVGCHFGIKPECWAYQKHHHHLYELLCCMEGKAVQEINGEKIDLNQGDWILLKPGVNHTIANSSPSHYAFFNIHFDLDDLDVRSRLGAVPFRLIPAALANESKLPKLLPELERLMQQELLSDETSISPDIIQLSLALHQRLALQAYVLLIIQEILLMLEAPAAMDTCRRNQVSAYEADVAHSIEERLAADLSANPSISAIAAEMSISRSQVSKIFAKVYGVSPRQYLSRRKWRKAKELLVTSNLTVYAIAEQLGFRSVHHFSRQFRRWVGMSPNQYRHTLPIAGSRNDS